MPKLEDYLALLKELDETDAKAQDQVFNSRTPMSVQLDILPVRNTQC